ncbi:flavodoxin family protein [Desulfovibrio litoralis]|uniref:Multimeric flavodoxin WrbA n=1 Tax=Desulfovibrio litoralis DSM 11393 TaxID=1121455 RepID=A0A1M7T919_9BACT|nr:flavodoxin family protein [Desulfovibrio litoralis]SHN67161.1 Multimeric flavodoxin WrbA [Desulfovibrio litoralis DSM 11393]
MKVLLINGSPRSKGNTALALNTVGAELNAAGIQTEMLQIGTKPVSGCIHCGTCRKKQNMKCAIDTDIVNSSIPLLAEADGIVLGSPVHFANMSGNMKGFLDRVFYVSAVNGGLLRHKVGASVAAVRRAGGIHVVDQLNKYLQYNEMLMPNSNYWTLTYGMNPGEVEQDLEGMQVMRMLGKNMAWLLKLVENGKGVVTPPAREDKVYMNFIR